LAWQCVHYFQPRSAPPEADYLRDRPPVRIDAVESYIRGLLSDSPEQRQKLFLQSAHLDPRYSEPAFHLGSMAFEKKDYQTARTWLEKVDANYSRFHEGQFLLALCHYYEGSYDVAIGIFQNIAAQVPLNEVFNDLGAAQSRKNQPAAIESFQKALEGYESDPDYWFNLGYAQWKNGRPADAALSFKAVLDRNPEDEAARTLLSRSQRGDLPHPGEAMNAERIKKTFEETVFLQLQAELKK
jgi:tetratricopeptide (TPR) repeat protein